MTPSPLLQSWLDLFRNVKPVGSRWFYASCPHPGHANGDTKQSLAITVDANGKVCLKCMVGHDGAEIANIVGKTVKDMYPGGEEKEDPRPTVGDVAWDKRLPSKYLTETWGLNEKTFPKYGKTLCIPYRDEAGKWLFDRWRVKLYGKGHTRQKKGLELQAYGQWRLPEARRMGSCLILVEGESDVWTLWHHGFPALGLPGAAAANTLTAPMLTGFDTVYVWKETDEGGVQFNNGVLRRLKEVGYEGAAKMIHGGTIKDPSALHVMDPEAFKDTFAQILGAAVDLAEAAKPAAHAHETNGHSGNGRQGPKATGRKPVRVPGVVTEGPAGAGKLPPPGFYGLTDLGNVQRLVFHHGDDVRWCRGWKQWLVWEGGRWVGDGEDRVAERAKKTVMTIYSEAGQAEDESLRRDTGKHAEHSESNRAVGDMMRLAKSERNLWIDYRKFDGQPWLLNCPNGTVDLRTGELLPHCRDHLLTKMCPTEYRPDAPCPLWEKFLSDVFLGDADLIAYVQRLFGYCLTGDVRKHLFVVFWGSGSNGKGTLLNTMHDAVGDEYASVSMPDLLMERRGERHPTEIADLFGKRMVSCEETAEGQSLNEPLVKWLTGGGILAGRRMNENLWRFHPTHKFILATNHRPKIQGTEKGIWRRVRLVPFQAVFEGEKEDTGLGQRLREEAEGVLAWAVRGCLEWQRQGEKAPQAVMIATEEYRGDEDMVQRFLSDCTRRKNGTVRAGVLYAAFREWAERGGERRVPSQNQFGRRLVDAGYPKVRSNGMWYAGIELVEQGGEPETEENRSGDSENARNEKTDVNHSPDRLSRFDH